MDAGPTAGHSNLESRTYRLLSVVSSIKPETRWYVYDFVLEAQGGCSTAGGRWLKRHL